MNDICEGYSFLLFFALGIIIGCIFDIFKSIRKVYKGNDCAIFIEDLLFIIISSFLIIYTLIMFNKGIIRFYIFMAFAMGNVIYSLTLSRLYVIILTRVVKICKNIMDIFILCFKYVTNILFRLYSKDF